MFIYCSAASNWHISSIIMKNVNLVTALLCNSLLIGYTKTKQYNPAPKHNLANMNMAK